MSCLKFIFVLKFLKRLDFSLFVVLYSIVNVKTKQNKRTRI